jgi:hypothetical protein
MAENDDDGKVVPISRKRWDHYFRSFLEEFESAIRGGAAPASSRPAAVTAGRSTGSGVVLHFPASHSTRPQVRRHVVSASDVYAWYSRECPREIRLRATGEAEKAPITLEAISKPPQRNEGAGEVDECSEVLDLAVVA